LGRLLSELLAMNFMMMKSGRSSGSWDTQRKHKKIDDSQPRQFFSTSRESRRFRKVNVPFHLFSSVREKCPSMEKNDTPLKHRTLSTVLNLRYGLASFEPC
jgi:hypothetical protein